MCEGPMQGQKRVTQSRSCSCPCKEQALDSWGCCWQCPGQSWSQCWGCHCKESLCFTRLCSHFVITQTLPLESVRNRGISVQFQSFATTDMPFWEAQSWWHLDSAPSALGTMESTKTKSSWQEQSWISAVEHPVDLNSSNAARKGSGGGEAAELFSSLVWGTWAWKCLQWSLVCAAQLCSEHGSLQEQRGGLAAPSVIFPLHKRILELSLLSEGVLWLSATWFSPAGDSTVPVWHHEEDARDLSLVLCITCRCFSSLFLGRSPGTWESKQKGCLSNLDFLTDNLLVVFTGHFLVCSIFGKTLLQDKPGGSAGQHKCGFVNLNEVYFRWAEETE